MSGFSSVGGASLPDLLAVLDDPGDGETITAIEEFLGTQNLCGLETGEGGTESRTVAPPTKPGTFLHLYNSNSAQNIELAFNSPLDSAGNTSLTMTGAGTAFCVLVSVQKYFLDCSWMLISGFSFEASA